MRWALTVVAGIAVLAVAGCGGTGGGSQAASPAAESSASAVRDLDNIAPLQAAFNADAGRSRLLLIFSPT